MAKDDASAHPDVIGGNARGQLISIVERIERLKEEAGGVADDLKEVYSEAKGNGFDIAILRKVIRRRAQDTAKRLEEDALVDLYESAINGTEQPFERAVQPGDTVNGEQPSEAEDEETYEAQDHEE